MNFSLFRYNEVLKNGLPNWRSAVYYYRHLRKMGLAEASIILFIIISLGQYAVSWAAYFEKRYTAVSLFLDAWLEYEILNFIEQNMNE